jgi:hypothetical protein
MDVKDCLPRKLAVAAAAKKRVVKDLRKGIYKIELVDDDILKKVEFWVSVGEPLNVRYDEWRNCCLTRNCEGIIIDVYRSGIT